MKKLLFLTSNAGKLAEARHLLSPLGFEVEQFLLRGRVPTVIEPQARDLKQVSQAKIEQAVSMLESSESTAILVEDAGLFIDGLNGFPGVYSADILGQIGLNGILSLMAEIGDNGAEFRACSALWIDGEIYFGEGICRGHIGTEIKGKNGFGYDPIFHPEGDAKGRTFGQMTTSEKEAFSHRAKALEEVKSLLSGLGR